MWLSVTSVGVEKNSPTTSIFPMAEGRYLRRRTPRDLYHIAMDMYRGSSRFSFIPFSSYSLFLLNFCNFFHEFNFEMENFLKINDETESGEF